MIDEKGLIDELTMCMEKEKFKCDQMADLNLKEAVVKYSHGQYCYANALHLVQSQQKVNKWIPCSERLPEIEKDVLVTDKITGDVTIAQLNIFNCFMFEDGRGHGASAWMPLPEPYKGK